MSYTALYRKFRPSEFEDVKGQDQFCCLRSDSCCKYTVISTRCATSLCVSRNCDTNFLVCLFFNLFCQFVSDRRIFSVCQLLFVFFLFQFCIFFGNRTLYNSNFPQPCIYYRGYGSQSRSCNSACRNCRRSRHNSSSGDPI